MGAAKTRAPTHGPAPWVGCPFRGWLGFSARLQGSLRPHADQGASAGTTQRALEPTFAAGAAEPNGGTSGWEGCSRAWHLPSGRSLALGVKPECKRSGGSVRDGAKSRHSWTFDSQETRPRASLVQSPGNLLLPFPSGKNNWGLWGWSGRQLSSTAEAALQLARGTHSPDVEIKAPRRRREKGEGWEGGGRGVLVAEEVSPWRCSYESWGAAGSL